MEKSYPDWTSLPAEILSKIFHYGYLHHPFYSVKRASFQAALVCKSWRSLTQSSLYSHVRIYSILQLRMFYDVIRCNTYIGTMVKVLVLQLDDIAESYKSELLAIVSESLSNCLPNLEYFHQDAYCSYKPTLNALLDSKLKYLRSIQMPYSRDSLDVDDELVQYVSSAFMIKDRLQEVYISNDLSHFLNGNTDKLAIIKFQQLYDNLNQFNNLTKIHITRQTDDGVQALEHILESCRSLRDIRISLSSIKNQYDYVQLKNNIYFDTISHYIPRYNIKTLYVCLFMSPIENCKVLLYIIKKFPNLEEFELRSDNEKFLQVTPFIIVQLLNYLDTIKQVRVHGLSTSQGDIYKIVGNFWNATSKPGKENVIFNYDYEDNIELKSTFGIHKGDGLVKGTQIHLKRSLKFFDRQPHMEFIEKNGMFIGYLQLEFECYGYDVDERSCDTSDGFLIHILMHCPNLQTLWIINFNQYKCVNSKFDKTKRYSLDFLGLHDCNINPGTLEQLSTVLSEVQRLQFVDAQFLNDDEEDNITRVNMPQTKIKLIILECFNESFPVYVKLFVVTDQKYYYYQANCKTDSIESSESETKIGIQIDEKVYDEGGKYSKFYVCCQTKPEIRFRWSK